MNTTEVRNRVKAAFTDLRSFGMIARMNHMCCMSCATASLDEVTKKSKRQSAAYFHRQDNECFTNGGPLHIRFFHDNDEKQVMWVGQVVQLTLLNHGLEAVWDKNPSHTIKVTGLKECEG